MNRKTSSWQNNQRCQTRQIRREYQRKPNRPMTSSSSTPTKCPPKHTGLFPRDIFKDPSIDHTIQKGQILKDILVGANISKRLLHMDRSCVGLHLVVTIVYLSRSPTSTQSRFSFCAGLQFCCDSIHAFMCSSIEK